MPHTLPAAHALRQTSRSVEPAHRGADGPVGGKIIKGNDGDNSLLGTKWADRIYGLGGNDWLIGDAGNDILVGGPGADKLNGNTGRDTASYADSPSGVTVNLLTQYGSGGDATGDVLSDIENLTGSAYGDVLKGEYDYGNVLKGGAGDDKLYGLGMNDSLYLGTGTDFADGGTGTDLVSWLGAARSVVADLADASRNAREAAGDTYINVEDIGGTNYGDTLSGDAFPNHLYGYKGNDTLDGRAGSDVLVGGPGRDTLTGGTGGDFFRQHDPSEGPDLATDFKAGWDTLSFDASGFGGTLVRGPFPPAALVKAADPAPASTGSVFLYDTTTGHLFFDVDGTGNAPRVDLMTLVGIPDIQATDFQLF